MAILTTLSDIQSIARGDDYIQGLLESDSEVSAALALAEKMVPEGKFGYFTKEAQTYLAAHLLSLANTNPGGRGPLSSESIGGISRSYTLPYLNQQTVIASTQYGLMFIELRRSVIVPVRVI